MHNVLKTKSSEQIEKEKKREEVKRINQYNTLVKKVLAQDKANIYDKESLELTTQILQLNAEFYTLWNYRRKIFVAWKENKSIDELQEIFDTELKFIEQLIPQNPKSYWLWLHRVWVTSNMAKCDWSRELKLCGKMLSVDERNFHCWDYRRYVANKAQATLQDEYDFTTKKNRR